MIYDEMLERLASAPIERIPLGDIQTDKMFQPREARLIPIRDKGRAEESSENHTATLRLILESSRQNELNPILVACITNTPSTLSPSLHVVDGHHRLRAYKQAKRESIPAHVLPMVCRTAVVISKIANCTGRSLAMHSEQSRDAAWQYLADVVQRGAIDLPKGESLRSVAARFGISKNTVSSMLSYLPRVELKEFEPTTLDPGTGWPRWRYVRQANSQWHTSLPSSSEDQLNKDAEKLARHIAKIIDTSSPAARARALEMLFSEEVLVSDKIESVELLSRISSPLGLKRHHYFVPMGTGAVPSQLAHLDT